MAVRTPIVVIGGGGHAKVVLHLLERLPQYEILGYLDPQDRGALLGHKWLGSDETAPALLAKHSGLAAALGVGKVTAASGRLELLRKLTRAGLAMPALVAASAVVARDCLLGEGSVVCEGAVIQPGCRLGLAAIVNTRAVIDHDCVLGEDVHVASGAVLSGSVTVGGSSMIGAGASCRHGVRIAEGCTIGAGAAVAGDCGEPGIYVGVPARRIRA